MVSGSALRPAALDEAALIVNTAGLAWHGLGREQLQVIPGTAAVPRLQRGALPH